MLELRCISNRFKFTGNDTYNPTAAERTYDTIKALRKAELVPS